MKGKKDNDKIKNRSKRRAPVIYFDSNIQKDCLSERFPSISAKIQPFRTVR